MRKRTKEAEDIVFFLTLKISLSGTQLKVGVIYVLENAFDLYIVSLEKKREREATREK